MPDAARTTRIREAGTVFVPVTDQERALDFYVGALGFEKRADFPYSDGSRWIEVAPPGAANTIALVPPSEGTSATIGDPVPPQLFFRDGDGSRFLIVQPG